MCASALRTAWVVAFLCGLLAGAPVEAQGRIRHERRLVLSELPRGSVPELRVAPGVRTLVLFDADLVREAVVLEGREHFVRKEVAERAIVLEPGPESRSGEPWRLTVAFREEGLSPSYASFRLVVHPTEVDGEVQVERGARSAEELRRELDAALARSAVASGLAGRILSRMLNPQDLTGGSFQGRVTSHEVRARPPKLWLADTWTLVVFQVQVPQGGAPWSSGQAVWLGAREEDRERVLPVWMEVERLGPGESGLVMVAVERAPGGTDEPLRLEVREKSGNRSVRIEEGF